MFSGYLWGALHADAVIGVSLFAGGVGMLLAAYNRGDTLEATWMGA